MHEGKEMDEYSPDKGKRSKQLDSLRIECAQNGYIVSCTYRSKNKHGEMTSSYGDENRKVFESAEAVADYVKEALA